MAMNSNFGKAIKSSKAPMPAPNKSSGKKASPAKPKKFPPMPSAAAQQPIPGGIPDNDGDEMD